MIDPRMPVRRSGAQDGRRKAERKPLTTRLLTRARTPRGRIAVAAAVAASAAIVGGAAVGATGAPPATEVESVTGLEKLDPRSSPSRAAERDDAQVSRSGERPAPQKAAPSPSIADAKKQQAAKTARAARMATRTARMKDRDPRQIAKAMLPDYGFSGQFGCLNDLWVGESNWRWNADNPTSSAYGIPQALPGSKMASAGADWKTNPATQIKWGLGYIKDRFGDPCSALAFKNANGWY
ncbi:lytic transglycosylase domain-containing protein [Mumia sp. zg.B21]|uniref:aggregation-promoting factor C-terminal-like domain-containing protein n=1 Tax=Mumia sp. zg.B21 TaxID=2855447 RepID=UPI001C6DEA9F|nr:lytic transglycosylase domain-containing protein [Mumia sp. zg.B21]MBW9210852.1 lytic transglycosylase domain-containing protein [Mumia sp. zg.B21]